MKRNYVTLGCLVVIFVVLLLPLQGWAGVKQLNMGGSTTTSSFYPYYTAVANSISESFDDINVTVVSTGGLSNNQKMIIKKDLNFSAMAPHLIAEGEEKGFDKFRVLWWMVPARQNIMARKDANISDFYDFNGKSFHPGMNGSSGQKIMLEIIKALKVKPKLYLSDPKDALNAIKNGTCLGQMKNISSDKLDAASAEVNLTTPLWPVGWSEKQRKIIKSELPWINFEQVKPGIVKGAPAYWLHVIWVGFVATTDMDADTAYKIVKGMYNGIDTQKMAFKGIKNRDILKQSLTASNYPFHSGAIKFYKEKGLEIPQHLIPPEMK